MATNTTITNKISLNTSENNEQGKNTLFTDEMNTIVVNGPDNADPLGDIKKSIDTPSPDSNEHNETSATENSSQRVPNSGLRSYQDSAGKLVKESGLNYYEDSSGNLLKGLDRLPALNSPSEQYQPDRYVPYVPSLDAQQASDAPPVPQPTPQPTPQPEQPEIHFFARAVIYNTQGSADASVRFRLLDSTGNPVDAHGVNAFKATSINGFFMLDGFTANPDGSISLALSPTGSQAIADALFAAGGNYSHASNLYEYITFYYDNHKYIMQVVINHNGIYAPSQADAAALAAGVALEGDLYGEWHKETAGTGKTNPGSRQIGDGKDECWFDSPHYGLINAVVNTAHGADRVHIAGSTVGIFSSGGASAITAVDGRVEISNGNSPSNTGDAVLSGNAGTTVITASSIDLHAHGGTTAYGMRASGAGSQNTLTAQKSSLASSNALVAITANATTGAYGLVAQNAGMNTITAQDGIAITAGDPINGAASTNAYGVYAYMNNGGNRLEASALANIAIRAIASGNNAYAMRGIGGFNEISNAKTVTLEAKTMGDGNSIAAGMHATNNGSIDGANSIHNVDTVHINTTVMNGTANSEAHGLYATVASGGNVSTNSIYGVNNIILNTANNVAGAANGLYAKWGENSLSARDVISINTTSNGEKNTAGVYSYYQSENSISSGVVNITTLNKGGGNAYGVDTNWGKNTVTATDSIVINSTCTGSEYYSQTIGVDAYATEFATGENSISGKNISITALNKGRGDAYALFAQGGENILTATKATSISATGGGVDYPEQTVAVASSGQTGKTTIAGGETLSIQAVNTQDGDVYGISTDEQATTSVSATQNVIIEATARGVGVALGIAGHKNATTTVAGDNVGITAHGMSGMIYGVVILQDDSPSNIASKNIINASESILIKTGNDTGDGIVSGIFSHTGSNTLGKDAVPKTITITATSGGNGAAFGVNAEVKGQNYLTATDDVTITATTNGSGNTHGINASTSGESKNTISAKNISVTSTKLVTGGGDVQGIKTSGGQNILTATNGDITVSASNKGYENTYGILSLGSGTNTLASKNISVSAHNSGIGYAHGLYVGGGQNTLTADHIDITASTVSASVYGLRSTSGNNVVNVGSTLTVDAIANALTSGGTYGLYAEGSGAKNHIEGTSQAINVAITATENAHQGTAIYSKGGGNNEIIGGKYAAGVINGDHITLNGDITVRDTAHATIKTGAGNDTLELNGNTSGMNINSINIKMGDGDDHVYLGGTFTGGTLAGGLGVDVLHLDKRDSVDLSSFTVAGTSIKGFEILDLEGGSGTRLNINSPIGGLTLDDLLKTPLLTSFSSLTVQQSDLENHAVLRVHGDANDTVAFSAAQGWDNTAVGNVVYDNINYDIFHNTSTNELLLIQNNIHIV